MAQHQETFLVLVLGENKTLMSYVLLESRISGTTHHARSIDLTGLKARQKTYALRIVQELCESRGGRPRLSVLTSLLVSVDVKNY